MNLNCQVLMVFVWLVSLNLGVSKRENEARFGEVKDKHWLTVHNMNYASCRFVDPVIRVQMTDWGTRLSYG